MLPASIESHPIAGIWAPDLVARYLEFARVLGAKHALEITIGRGGLSFYAHPGAARRTFICHFNAAPRSGRDDLGFADFKPRALAPQLDPDAVVADLQRRLGPSVGLRAGKVWYGAHFASKRDAHVAAAFRDAVVAAVFGQG